MFAALLVAVALVALASRKPSGGSSGDNSAELFTTRNGRPAYTERGRLLVLSGLLRYAARAIPGSNGSRWDLVQDAGADFDAIEVVGEAHFGGDEGESAADRKKRALDVWISPSTDATPELWVSKPGLPPADMGMVLLIAVDDPWPQEITDAYRGARTNKRR